MSTNEQGAHLVTDWAALELRAAEIQRAGIRLTRLARQGQGADRTGRARIRLAIVGELRLLYKGALQVEALDEAVGEAMRVHRDVQRLDQSAQPHTDAQLAALGLERMG